MAENKTKPTAASVKDYIASRANEQQAADCKTLMTNVQENHPQAAADAGTEHGGV
jgi:hypothetical protein